MLPPKGLLKARAMVMSSGGGGAARLEDDLFMMSVDSNVSRFHLFSLRLAKNESRCDGPSGVMGLVPRFVQVNNSSSNPQTNALQGSDAHSWCRQSCNREAEKYYISFSFTK